MTVSLPHSIHPGRKKSVRRTSRKHEKHEKAATNGRQAKHPVKACGKKQQAENGMSRGKAGKEIW